MSITQEELRSRLFYNGKTGEFFHLKYKNSTKATAGWKDSLGYIHIRLDRLYLAHRLAWLYTYGKWPQKNLDHINGNPSDNRIENLREADQHLNCRNGKIKRKNASIRSGVSFDNARKKFRAYINVDYTQKFLGRFSSLEEAMAARDKAEEVIYGEFRRRA